MRAVVKDDERPHQKPGRRDRQDHDEQDRHIHRRVHHRRQREVGQHRRGDVKHAAPKVRLGVRSERLAPKGGVEAPATALATTTSHSVVHVLLPSVGPQPPAGLLADADLARGTNPATPHHNVPRKRDNDRVRTPDERQHRPGRAPARTRNGGSWRVGSARTPSSPTRAPGRTAALAIYRCRRHERAPIRRHQSRPWQTNSRRRSGSFTCLPRGLEPAAGRVRRQPRRTLYDHFRAVATGTPLRPTGRPEAPPVMTEPARKGAPRSIAGLWSPAAALASPACSMSASRTARSRCGV